MSYFDNYRLHTDCKRKYLAKGADYITFDEVWSVKCELDAISFAVEDFNKCLNQSFGVKLGTDTEKNILFLTNDALEPHSFNIKVQAEGVVFEGSDASALVQAIYYAEDVMKNFGDASIKIGEYNIKPAVWPRIATSALDGGIYTEEYIDILLHFGYNGIVFYEHDEAMLKIAKNMGMLVYINADSTSDAFLYDGIVVENIPENNDLKLDNVIYSSLYWDVPLNKKIEIIDSLPEGCSLILSFDADQVISRDGIEFNTASGSLVMAQCSDAFCSCIELAQKKNINVIASTCLAGRTNEFSTVPYIPAMMQWFMRIESLKEMGITATIDTERYGFLPSIVGEFSKSQLLLPCDEGGIAVQKLVIRHYGAENSEKIMMAFKKVTDGVNWLIYNQADKEGPMQFGAAYPLINGDLYNYDFSVGDVTYETDINLKAADAFNKAAMILKHIENDEIRQVENILRFMVNTLITCANTKRWYRRIYTLKNINDDYKKKFLQDQMIKIGDDELKNANDTADIIINAEYLSYNNFDGFVTPNALDAKIKLTQAAITEIKKNS